MSVNNDKLAKIFALLLDDGSSQQQAQQESQQAQSSEQESAKQESANEQQAKESAKEAKEPSKNNSEGSEKEPSKDDSDGNEKYGMVDEELRKKLDEQFVQVASSHIVSETSGIGLDNDNVKKLLQFVNYDTMKNENGDLDEDKASSLVTVISNISLRKPPSSGASQNLSRSQRGMGKYLKN